MQKEHYQNKVYYHYSTYDEPVIGHPSHVFRLGHEFGVIPIRVVSGQLYYYIDASRILTKADLYRLFADILEFPDYFGSNLDALYDCLSDLEWIKSPYISLRFIGWEQALMKEDINFRNQVLSLVQDVNRYWRKQHHPKLYIILQ